MPLTPTECPNTSPYSVDGNGKHEGPTAEALKRAMKRAQYGFSNKALGDLSQTYNAELEAALDRWDAGANGYGEGRWKKIRALRCPAESPSAGQYALDEYALRLIRDEAMRSSVPALGPVFSGGSSVLDHDLTHRTSGLDPNGTGEYWPAFDDAFARGKRILAPETMHVTKASSSNPGDACYLEGRSGLRWWFGHLELAPVVGTLIRKGATIGKTCANSVGGGPHIHVAINVEQLWGAGKRMTHHVNYTHGAPTVGAQLSAGRAL